MHVLGTACGHLVQRITQTTSLPALISSQVEAYFTSLTDYWIGLRRTNASKPFVFTNGGALVLPLSLLGGPCVCPRILSRLQPRHLSRCWPPPSLAQATR